MSLGEATELFQSLAEIDKLLSQIQIKTNTLHAEMPHTLGNLREIEYLLYRTSSLLGRLGLPPELDKAIMIVQRMILMIRMLHSAIILAESSTPYGWILAGISAATLAVNVSTTAEMIFQDTRGT